MQYYQIFFSYDFNYITGNAPEGVFKLDNKKYIDKDEAIKKFKKKIFKRNQVMDLEWKYEYRLGLFKIENDKKTIFISDYPDNFWHKN